MKIQIHTMFVILTRDMDVNAVRVRVHSNSNPGAKLRTEAGAQILHAIQKRHS